MINTPSLDYIRYRIASGKTGLTDIVWDDISELNFKEEFKITYNQDFPECNKSETKLIDGTMIAEFIYDPDADFNYFSMERTVHDGTFLFIGDTIERLIHKVFMCRTYNKDIMNGIPGPEEDSEFFTTHHFKYTIGDIGKLNVEGLLITFKIK